MLSPRAEEGFWGDRVMPDNRAVGRLAAEYLLGRGHRSLAYLLLDPTHYGFEARRSAFVATAERSGAEVLVATDSEASRELQTDPSFAVESIDRALGQIRAAPQRPTGLFVPSDQLVALVYGRLRAAGLEPQRDIDIISCDNEWTIDALYPKPATIDLRAELIGEVAVQQLLHRIEHPASEHVSATLTIDGYVVEPTESLSGAPNLPPDRVRAENAEAGASGVVPGEPEEHV
ncbi:MAG: substrate-binding domain-containing protein [Planctomycetota bacterium]